jgi:uncharacterized protein (DUF433 family)
MTSRTFTRFSLPSRRPAGPGRRLAVEHVLAMIAAGDTPEALIEAHPFLQADDIRACLLYAYKLVAHERVEPFSVDSAA